MTSWQSLVVSRRSCVVRGVVSLWRQAMVCQLISNVCGQMQICRNKKHRVAKTAKYTRTNMGKCELFMKNVLEMP